MTIYDCRTHVHMTSMTSSVERTDLNFKISVALVFARCHFKDEPPPDKTNKMACASSEDSDQPGYPPSLISLCCSREESLGP